MYSLVYAFFMCELQKIFFLKDMMDNQCANIFSTHTTIYGSHSVKFAFIERENIFLHVYSQLSFLSSVCVFFIFPHLLNFPKNCFFPKLVLFFLFLQGEKHFFLPVLFIRGVVSILYRVELFCVPLILYFLLSFIAYVYSLLSCLCQYVTKRGRSR